MSATDDIKKINIFLFCRLPCWEPHLEEARRGACQLFDSVGTDRGCSRSREARTGTGWRRNDNAWRNATQLERHQPASRRQTHRPRFRRASQVKPSPVCLKKKKKHSRYCSWMALAFSHNENQNVLQTHKKKTQDFKKIGFSVMSGWFFFPPYFKKCDWKTPPPNGEYKYWNNSMQENALPLFLFFSRPTKRHVTSFRATIWNAHSQNVSRQSDDELNKQCKEQLFSTTFRPAKLDSLNPL